MVDADWTMYTTYGRGPRKFGMIEWVLNTLKFEPLDYEWILIWNWKGPQSDTSVASVVEEHRIHHCSMIRSIFFKDRKEAFYGRKNFISIDCISFLAISFTL